MAFQFLCQHFHCWSTRTSGTNIGWCKAKALSVNQIFSRHHHVVYAISSRSLSFSSASPTQLISIAFCDLFFFGGLVDWNRECARVYESNFHKFEITLDFAQYKLAQMFLTPFTHTHTHQKISSSFFLVNVFGSCSPSIHWHFFSPLANENGQRDNKKWIQRRKYRVFSTHWIE